jgi:hypothetical protein
MALLSINAKRALTLTGFSSTVKSAPFGSFILFFDFNLSGALFHFAVITKGRYP